MGASSILDKIGDIRFNSEKVRRGTSPSEIVAMFPGNC